MGMGGVRGWRGGEGAKGTRILGLGGAPKVGLLGEIMGSMAVKVGSTGAKMGSPNLGIVCFVAVRWDRLAKTDLSGEIGCGTDPFAGWVGRARAGIGCVVSIVST